MNKPAINKRVFSAISDACITTVEDMPQTQAFLAKRDELMDKIEGKVSRHIEGEICDLYLNLAVHFGDEMFKLGLELGRNPSAIFDLPDDGEGAPL